MYGDAGAGRRPLRLPVVYRVILAGRGVQRVLNVDATSLAVMTRPALVTFVVGIWARVCQMCIVRGVFFAVVPGLGWLG